MCGSITPALTVSPLLTRLKVSAVQQLKGDCHLREVAFPDRVASSHHDLLPLRVQTHLADKHRAAWPLPLALA